MDRLILALDVSGYPYAWLTWQEAVVHQCAGRVARQLGDFHFTFHGGRNRHTGLPSAITISSIVALRGRNPLAWRFQTIALTNAALFHRDRQTCAYCGKHFSSSDLTRDHILPLALGGRDSWNNCTTACKLSPPKHLPVFPLSPKKSFHFYASHKNATGNHNQFALPVQGAQ